MDIKNKWFRFHGWRNNTLSGEPVGFWLMWRPRPPTDPYEPGRRFCRIPCAWMLTVWLGGARLTRG